MSIFSSVIIGNESLVIQCADMLLTAQHDIRAIVTRNEDVRDWANSKGLSVVEPSPDLTNDLKGLEFDWLLSVANLDIISPSTLDLAKKGAVNFHDGPLPGYAGLNAPVWAIVNGETKHGITWHLIADTVDAGDILQQQMFDIADGETALSLNTKCYSAAIESFADVIANLESGTPDRRAQDLSKRSYYAKDTRPTAAARLDFSQPAKDIVRLVQALDHGTYWNPLSCAKIEISGKVWTVGAAAISTAVSDAAPGTVLSSSVSDLTIATGSAAIALSNLRDNMGNATEPSEVAKTDDVVSALDDQGIASIEATIKGTLANEPYWRKRLQEMQSACLPLINAGQASGVQIEQNVQVSSALTSDDIFCAMAAMAAQQEGKIATDLATQPDMPGASAYTVDWVPVRFTAAGSFQENVDTFSKERKSAISKGAFSSDLAARLSGNDPVTAPQIGLSEAAADGLVSGTVLTLTLNGDSAVLIADEGCISAEILALYCARLEKMLSFIAHQDGKKSPAADIPILSDVERDMVLNTWNNTQSDFDENTCVHQYFERQVDLTPDAVAVVFEDENLTYGQLNASANRIAFVLRKMGVGPGSIVGLHVDRSVSMLTGALAILKAGGAYVPLDPNYPSDRLALYISDSAAAVILTDSSLASALPDHQAAVLEMDTDGRISDAASDNPDSGVAGNDLAYLIYTSGSTGKPKGVMVEHRNVSNFFTGMDERVERSTAGVWLAVTSLSFDISVLELFYTLARGFKLVINSDDGRLQMSNGQIEMTGKGMEFSLFFWGNDDGVGRDKYKLLLEGAKFADKNGFTAVWTPERHFHAFGGPYPNSAVTGAAVAAVTENIGVRSGSCVAPLHHTARIAEDWAVIDNLTNGRAGLGIASGWQPDDFVLRPENSPPNNKPAMFQAIKDLRKLWAGEAVEFPTKSGEPFKVTTLPRPVSKQVPIWVTIAGNPDTWREAGEIGANVLTHLLGQTAEDISERIKLYHDGLRSAGHDPKNHKITLMLHSFVGRDRERVRETARGPMKAYMGAAAGLIRLCAWDFPAFKRPKGAKSPFDIDLATLGADEVDAILEFAFERYFDTAGLFGTVEDCLKRVEELKRIGVDEIACLIDYGIPVPEVLESLFPLAEVLRRSNETSAIAEDDFSVAAQIIRHGVTHLQCTPSMARMIEADQEAGQALGHIDHLYLGGEALPAALVNDLRKTTDATIENMYGPTETTIWSSTETVETDTGTVNIGTPISNTQLYVLDEKLTPVPIGVEGELYIGGKGVARGYWNRDDTTAECFLSNPFSDEPGARIYKTGDRVRRRFDGKIDYLGRADFQIKIRGFRIELGEIETALETISGVKQAVVTDYEFETGDNRLVAYIQTTGQSNETTIRKELAQILPTHMVPSHFVALDTFPLTPNNKVDRNALPSPGTVENKAREQTVQVLANNTEKVVAEIWTGILGVANIGPKDSFFELGGHSLLAVQAHREIRAAIDVPKLTITDIFRYPTLSALAASIDERMGNTGTGQSDPEAEKEAAEQETVRTDAMSRRKAMREMRKTGAR